MVRALTKKTRQGKPYVRRPEVEQCIAEAVNQAPATLRARALIVDPADPRYLPSETLVHLSRSALRTRDDAAASALIGCLGRRCEANLARHIRPTNLFDADDVRAAGLSKFYDLFADELEDPSKDALDYYEVQFNAAILKMRLDVVRSALRHRNRFRSATPMPQLDCPDGDDDAPGPMETADPSPDSDPLLQADAHDLLRRVQALPPIECEAVFWKLLDFKTEADDPTEKTVATLCGISGRAARSRLASARAHLKSMEEESP